MCQLSQQQNAKVHWKWKCERDKYFLTLSLSSQAYSQYSSADESHENHNVDDDDADWDDYHVKDYHNADYLDDLIPRVWWQ